ncbi:exodeoxyribonuclease V subunit beta [Neisseria sp. N95_16]|uniref:RecBCD enzyme subunit RecB n=1 Tax=Neisseria brasiliensis TaxID=2666100 RepID=A0A7X2H0I2_9NEIS|nr:MULTISPECIES: exodeoxyribonuclease V subunit beta [Neisseria]MRN39326.1 exodeoxyribonuclease V subunit beta [Neisseria brasiliensis]PJO09467.1 exodeoxyribonuclease V subunit beta [Neisseria sp. N95_16]
MSHSVHAFAPLSIPIQGTNLIEASAGTGKTYGIAALFTRLIVLEKMPVDKVLVVTFTKAATAELKTRLRARLDEVLQALESVANAAEDSDGLNQYCEREHPGDVFLKGLLQQALAQESQARLIVRLKAAIGDFDNASIYTIHGFCQRVLRDFAFLCQTQFDVELADDSRERLLVPAQDFWRERISNDPMAAELVFRHRETPQTMLAEIRPFVSRPYLVFRRPENGLAAARTDLQQAWENIQGRLKNIEEAFWQAFDGGILSGTFFKKPSYQSLFAALWHAAETGRLPPSDADSLKRLENLRADVLPKKLKKKQSLSSQTEAELHGLGLLGEKLQAAADEEENALTLLKLDLLDHINQALAEQKKSRRERTFDDLLLDVFNALQPANPHAQALAEAVAATWQVALIDEFQDTDPLQYQIFSEIFIRQNKPLFLVGDPKQAIYSFRGADIYAYLQAAEDAQQHYTLATNFRSHAKLINGIGALFQCKNRPFVLENIDYNPVGAVREESRLSPSRPAVQVRWLHGNETEPLDKDVLRKRAAEYCADEIAFALNEAAKGRLNFKERPLESGDIAVLVRTHNEGSMIAQALKSRRIQSVLLHRESVFESPEAQGLAALLDFWLNPRRTESLRFALSGVLFGYDADALYALNQSEAGLLAWIDSAERAAQLWQQKGIYTTMQHFSAEHGIEIRLLSDGNGRSLTNYHQLLERLSEENEQSHSPASLHQWLLAQINLAENGKAGDNNVLRLESDEALVKIVTMHAAKGLQYPLVYCPFVWDAQDNKAHDWQILHRDGGESELLAEHQLDDDDHTQLADEEMAERLRLLYVALTRAEEQLSIYAAYCQDTDDNTFAYLLEGHADSTREAVKAAYEGERKAGKGAAEMAMLKNNWARFINKQAENENTDFVFTEDTPPSAAYHSAKQTEVQYQAADIPPRGFEYIRHTSFTGLSRHVKAHDSEREELQPSLDAAESHIRPSENVVEKIDHDELSIHHFPRGTNAGLCLHDMLENLDFQRSAAEQSEQILETLTRHGFEEKWLPAVMTMLDCCRETPISGKDTLSDIQPSERLPEMGFTLYMQDFNLAALRAWFAQPHLGLPPECIEAAQRLDFQDVQGYLNGFIDMTCIASDGQVCVIDYKSNYLGANAAAYTPQAMNEAMGEHHYYLQALIYAIAVGRYFKLRGLALPQIAVRYLFLRGMNGTENGIWSWDIDAEDLADWV